jgi:hypothetical protein
MRKGFLRKSSNESTAFIFQADEKKNTPKNRKKTRRQIYLHEGLIATKINSFLFIMQPPGNERKRAHATGFNRIFALLTFLKESVVAKALCSKDIESNLSLSGRSHR